MNSWMKIFAALALALAATAALADPTPIIVDGHVVGCYDDETGMPLPLADCMR